MAAKARHSPVHSVLETEFPFVAAGRTAGNSAATANKLRRIFFFIIINFLH